MKKRILVIGLTEKMGGVETFIYNTTRFSNKNKYEYDFLIHGTMEPVFKKEINKFYGKKNHFFFVPSFKKDPIKAIKSLSSFYKENGNNYDYVHLETGSTAEIVYVFPFCYKYKFKVITHSHNGNGYSPIINSLFRPILNFVSKSRLSCSDEATNWLFGKQKKGNVQIINNGIDVDRFTFDNQKRESIRKKYNIPSNAIVVGHIGRFSEQKNHIFLLEVFNNLVKSKRPVILMLVGVGELIDDIKEKANEMEVSDKIIFCGLQCNTEDFYSAFDVFVMPSLYEGLPIVGIEAQCEGLPCFFSSNISKKIKITSNANIMDLDKGAPYWAEKISTSYKETIVDRKKFTNDIIDKNFSISNTIRKLEEVYDT